MDFAFDVSGAFANFLLSLGFEEQSTDNPNKRRFVLHPSRPVNSKHVVFDWNQIKLNWGSGLIVYSGHVLPLQVFCIFLMAKSYDEWKESMETLT